MLYKAIFSEDFLSDFRLDDNGKTLVLTDERGYTRAVRLIEEHNVVSTKDKELIEKLEQIEAVMIPPCFKADMEAVKGQMLELLDKMTLNTMKRPDVVAVLEIFLAYLRQGEKST